VDLTGKLAVVTGAARGIGFAIARRFAAEGASVAVVVHRLADGDDVCAKLKAEGLSAMAYECDVSSADAVSSLAANVMEQQGCADILVNNAAIYPTVDILDMTESEFSRTFRVNVTSVFLMSQAFARQMISSKKTGTIVNIGSIAATMASPRAVAYGASKGAVHSLTVGLSLALAPHGIRVNAIAPGTVATELTKAMVETPDLRNMVLSRTPAGHFGSPEDIAGAALFLASQDSSFVTGQTIYADGGRSGLSFTVPVNKGWH